MAAEKVKNNAVIATHNQKKISIKVSLEYRDFILKNIINKMTGTTKAAIRLRRLIREIFLWLWIVITALFLTFSAAIYDFSRIFKLRDDKNILYSFKKGIIFTFSNKLNILAIFVLYALSLAIIYLVYLLVMGIVHDLLYVFLVFLIYQGFIMVRYFLKIVVMRAEIRLLS